MADKTLDVICICGSLRKGSYNRMVMNALPGLAPANLKLTEAPPFADFPLYNADVQDKGIPPAVLARVTAIDLVGSEAGQPIGYALAGPVAAAAAVHARTDTLAGLRTRTR